MIGPKGVPSFGVPSFGVPGFGSSGGSSTLGLAPNSTTSVANNPAIGFGNSPFAPANGASVGAKVPFEDSAKTSESEVEWLRQVHTLADVTYSLPNPLSMSYRNRYSGTTSIAVKCGSDEKAYLFPQEVLMQNFRYFREQAPPAGDKVHHFQDITTPSFARLVRWTQTNSGSHEDPANPGRDYTVQELLDQMIAAHRLGLDNADKFHNHVVCLLATVLLRDRRKLSSEHINLVASHPSFAEDSLVMRVFVRAGLRPFLQSTMLSKEQVMMKSSAMPGHQSALGWNSILQHCRKLRLDNDDYALRVARHADDVMQSVGRTVDGTALFYDSLDDDEMKGRRTLHFGPEFSI